MVGFPCLTKIKLFMDDDFIGMPEEKKCLPKIAYFIYESTCILLQIETFLFYQ